MAAVPEIDSDGDVVRAHKAESNRLTLPREALYAFSFLLVGLCPHSVLFLLVTVFG
jgi:hypothetical protein